MRWKAAILTGLAAAAIGLTFTPRADADPPSWAGRWRHGDGRNDRYYDRQWSREHETWHRGHPAHGWNGWSGDRNGDWYRYRWGSRWYGPLDRGRGWSYSPDRARPWWYGYGG